MGYLSQAKYALAFIAGAIGVSACIDASDVQQYVRVSHKCVLSDDYAKFCHFRETINFDDRRGQMYCVVSPNLWEPPVCYNAKVQRLPQ